ncbi:uncharacterized protein G2W53_024504 [Senna tora]|uniref:Uncharacterized protein n=1 Tax=Senna tora TaxID=362788 RepID=A0A834WJ64_9FABA|nr:uncharacterized protein G2W53_024504 [Senna tora]
MPLTEPFGKQNSSHLTRTLQFHQNNSRIHNLRKALLYLVVAVTGWRRAAPAPSTLASLRTTSRTPPWDPPQTPPISLQLALNIGSLEDRLALVLAQVYPSLYLPALVGLVYSPNEIVQSTAVDSFIGIDLKLDLAQINGSFLSRWENRNYTRDILSSRKIKLYRFMPLDLHPVCLSSQILNLPTYYMPSCLEDTRDIENGYECIAALLLGRAFCEFEFEDVRKLAAEQCGCNHPQVIISDIFGPSQDRSCESFSHPAMLGTRKIIETILYCCGLVWMLIQFQKHSMDALIVWHC